MKRILIPMISMVALCLHSDTQEEVRRFIREAVEVFVQPDTLERREQWKPMASKLMAIKGDVRLSVYCEIMAEKFDDPNPKYVNYLMVSFYDLDGTDLASYGNQESLDWARRVLREKGKGFDRGISRMYLVLKGNERDIDSVTVRRDILAARVAGTNVVNNPYFSGLTHSPSVHLFSVVPSVTNTGPQALYVEAIFRQYWEQLEIDDGAESWGHPFRDPSKIPAELLTMVVWFDGDDNPVCNVDLSKYGLTMPELDVPNKPAGKTPPPEPPPAIVDVTEQTPAAEDEPDETPPPRPSASPCLLICIAVTLPLGIGAALCFARRKK